MTYANAYNVTNGTANDTRDLWQTLPSGVYSFNANNMLKNQPDQYGNLLHMHSDAARVINQMFFTSTGHIYTRLMNASVDTSDSAFKMIV